jgi:nucleotide-binding universal stress UspA family protein
MADQRVFLVVVDDTPELRAALRYACRRALHTDGRVALLRVIEPSGFRDFAAIGALMRDEARAEAETLLTRIAALVETISGQIPSLYVREGIPREEVIRLITDEPTLSLLVLAADPGPAGPGPLVSALTGRQIGQMRVPVIIVPGSLSDSQIDAIA